jgi:membrane-associated phospholipid phosphatase
MARTWTDRIAAAYLLLVAAIVVIQNQHVEHWLVVSSLHLLLAGAILALHRLPASSPKLIRFLRDWYPVPMFGLMFKEVEFLAAQIGDWSLTGRIQALERQIFGAWPAEYLSDALAWVPLSEFLHLSYISYLLFMPVVGGIWYATGRREAFDELILLFTATMAISYTIFILWPVDSPYYLLDPPGEPLAGHLFYELVHFVSDRGGARGGAFPSAHTSVACLVWLVAWTRDRRLAYFLTPLAAGILVATIYGRFHYVVDVVAGIALAVAVFAAHRWVTKPPGPSQNGGG